MNYTKRKLNSISRYILWHFLSKELNLIHVAEYPKSGGSWLTQLISNYTGIVSRRDQLPRFEKSIMHGHYLYSNSFNKPICVIRDGRDIMVSYYHHMIIGHSRVSMDNVIRNRSKSGITDFENIKKNLPRFIEYLNTDYKKGYNKFSWSDFINAYLDKDNVCFIKYEDMLSDCENELKKVLKFIESDIDLKKVKSTIEQFSFKSQTKRNPGDENKKSFLRKGISGDWKNYFTEESASMFDKFSGEELIKLGYEKDNSWVNKI